ncbi:hypothetical protein JAAARDRAFT_178155 [Jaapia argillacea MUCL 33604]|uniref:Letm1 RBD domain-containing protein n=1 Tax=Jaapia argillacea MUCL 33604 TaxID=933084 RepID=A0A067Q2L7_9AGAM|nr:hypothetical protein JAAARDRAFT_178155 [Jaapia argillacea MUCL 33604]
MIRSLARNGLVERFWFYFFSAFHQPLITVFSCGFARSVATTHRTPVIQGRWRYKSTAILDRHLSPRDNISFRLVSRAASSSSRKTPSTSKPSETTLPPPQPPAHKPKVELRPAPIKPSKASLSVKPADQGAKASPPTVLSKEQPSPGTTVLREANKKDMEDAQKHGILAPPPPDAGRVGQMWHNLKQYFKFYVRGIKMVYTHWERARAMNQRVASGGHPLTRWETRFLKTHQSDMIKIVPFIMIVVIIEEIIPLIVLYVPGMLPSTCVLPSQRERIEQKRHERQQVAADKLRGFFEQIRTKGEANGSVPLAELTQTQLRAICMLLDLSSRGVPSMTAKRIKKRLEYIAKDDELLTKEGMGERLSTHEIIEALHERGVVTAGIREKDLLTRLRWWLNNVSKSDQGDDISRRIAVLGKAGAWRW